MNPAGTAEEQAKNFQWGLRKSTLNHLMCIPFTDVAQVANAARNYEILHERDDDGAERPDYRQKSGDRHQPTTQQSSHRNHEIREEFHTSSGPSNSGGNPLPVTIYTWLEGNAEEQAKNFQWGLRSSYLMHVVLIRGVDVHSNFPRVVTIMVSEPGFRPVGSKDLTCEDWTLLPQIREEFRTGSGPSGSGGNPLPDTIHTWLERFNKQNPRSFEKATAPVDAEN
nr:hypothetical protein [Tanacetum cinerariifolium]